MPLKYGPLRYGPLKFGLSLCLLGAFAGSSAYAQEQLKGVVELFTSQGCASCPPADETLRKLIQKGDVVGLSYHVDYWNYLGWADSLASKENTERQYGYARALGRNNVYTPQAVVNGRDHVKGADIQAIYKKLDSFKNAGEGLNVPVKAQRLSDEIEIDIGAGQGKADVVVAYFTREQIVDVQKGENQGKKISYWHSVYDVQTVGMWNGSSMTVKLPASVMSKAKNGGCAVLLQTTDAQGNPAAIIGASVLLPSD
ncbi:DUF1223 domain-containing protein [Agrobacterium sp. rho-13.3]|jgi:hypothetical protein|uniref:DUF1223 domain-containing protein n=1 Tax=Agrobacterium sp. rho-13.3 TaxID=3072980 RepID=UPI002A132298|nr:thioredoxin family protein [Agrobacterium sp. rho-13.3]MDX8311032.1 thioredoxin family protein [Agrobacterium sp. rho-13.3]